MILQKRANAILAVVVLSLALQPLPMARPLCSPVALAVHAIALGPRLLIR